MLTPGHAKGVSLHHNCSADYIHNTGARICSLDLWIDASCCYTLCLKLRKASFEVERNLRVISLRSSHSDLVKMNEVVCCSVSHIAFRVVVENSHVINPLNPELNPICYLLALLAHHFLHVSRIMVKSLTLRLLMSYIYEAHILDVSRSHTTTHHSR